MVIISKAIRMLLYIIISQDKGVGCVTLFTRIQSLLGESSSHFDNNVDISSACHLLCPKR